MRCWIHTEKLVDSLLLDVDSLEVDGLTVEVYHVSKEHMNQTHTEELVDSVEPLVLSVLVDEVVVVET